VTVVLVFLQGKPPSCVPESESELGHWVHISGYVDGRCVEEVRDCAKETCYDVEKVASLNTGSNSLGSSAQGSPREQMRTRNLH